MQLTVVTSLLGALALLLSTACTRQFEAVPESECPQLAAHTRKLLGEGARDMTDEQMRDTCLKATPKQRGCVKAASDAADLMKCSLVRE